MESLQDRDDILFLTKAVFNDIKKPYKGGLKSCRNVKRSFLFGDIEDSGILGLPSTSLYCFLSSWFNE
jgi:hypothetical protein